MTTTTDTRDYQSIITANISAADALSKIAQVSDWWNRQAKGNAEKLGDTFKVDFGHVWVEFEIVEAIPNKRVVWLVTDCHIDWLKDKSEWKGTKIIWDVTTKDGVANVTMTHAGLTPAMECFENCEMGWNFYTRESLPRFFADGRGLPDREGR